MHSSKNKLERLAGVRFMTGLLADYWLRTETLERMICPSGFVYVN